jgi:hypothetical protein
MRQEEISRQGKKHTTIQSNVQKCNICTARQKILQYFAILVGFASLRRKMVTLIVRVSVDYVT